MNLRTRPVRVVLFAILLSFHLCDTKRFSDFQKVAATDDDAAWHTKANTILDASDSEVGSDALRPGSNFSFGSETGECTGEKLCCMDPNSFQTKCKDVEKCTEASPSRFSKITGSNIKKSHHTALVPANCCPTITSKPCLLALYDDSMLWYLGRKAPELHALLEEPEVTQWLKNVLLARWKELIQIPFTQSDLNMMQLGIFPMHMEEIIHELDVIRRDFPGLSDLLKDTEFVQYLRQSLKQRNRQKNAHRAQQEEEAHATSQRWLDVAGLGNQ